MACTNKACIGSRQCLHIDSIRRQLSVVLAYQLISPSPSLEGWISQLIEEPITLPSLSCDSILICPVRMCEGLITCATKVKNFISIWYAFYDFDLNRACVWCGCFEYGRLMWRPNHLAIGRLLRDICIMFLFETNCGFLYRDNGFLGSFRVHLYLI